MDRIGRGGGKKKLVEAAAWWARLPSSGGDGLDSVERDMATLGVHGFAPPDWMREEDAPEDFGVLEENWEAVSAFLACATQWRHNRDDVPIGLSYEALDIVIRHSGVERPADVFWRVKIMEGAALKEFAAMRKR